MYTKTLTKILRRLISLMSLAAKLLEGLEPSCLPKFTPVTTCMRKPLKEIHRYNSEQKQLNKTQ